MAVMARLAFHRGALALALFALSGQLFGIAHLLLVPHAVCAAHGELIHVERAANTAAPTAVDSTRAAYRGEAGGETSDSHEHCLAFALRREHHAAAAVRALVVPKAPAKSTRPHADSAAVVRAALILLFAPKGSPPIARA
jgi:hypothetical protein